MYGISLIWPQLCGSALAKVFTRTSAIIERKVQEATRRVLPIPKSIRISNVFAPKIPKIPKSQKPKSCQICCCCCCHNAASDSRGGESERVWRAAECVCVGGRACGNHIRFISHRNLFTWATVRHCYSSSSSEQGRRQGETLLWQQPLPPETSF